MRIANDKSGYEVMYIEDKPTDGDISTEEDLKFAAEVAEIEAWWKSPRWSKTQRPYTAEQICAKRGNLQISYASNDMSKKLWHILEHRWQVSSIHNKPK